MIYGRPVTLGGGSGGVGLNIAYGVTPPEDKTKLWVPLTKTPASVEISGDLLQSASDTVSTAGAPLTNKTYRYPSVELDGKIYTFGTTTMYVEIYDPEADACALGTTKPPVNCTNALAVAYKGKAYILGGGGSTYVYEYDPTTEVFTRKVGKFSACPAYGAAALAYGKIYTFGGSTSSNPHNYIQEYDPEKDVCVKKSVTLDGKLRGHCAEALDGVVYILGGYGTTTTGTKKIQVYDPVANTLTVLDEQLPRAMRNACSGVQNGKIYLLGGLSTNTSTYYDDVMEYDPKTKSCIIKEGVNLVQPIGYAGSAVAGDTIYIMGTVTAAGDCYTIQKYTPRAYLTANHLKLFATPYRSEAHQVVTKIVNGKRETIKLFITAAYIGGEDGYAVPQDAYVFNTDAGIWHTLDTKVVVSTSVLGDAELGEMVLNEGG